MRGKRHLPAILVFSVLVLPLFVTTGAAEAEGFKVTTVTSGDVLGFWRVQDVNRPSLAGPDLVRVTITEVDESSCGGGTSGTIVFSGATMDGTADGDGSGGSGRGQWLHLSTWYQGSVKWSFLGDPAKIASVGAGPGTMTFQVSGKSLVSPYANMTYAGSGPGEKTVVSSTCGESIGLPITVECGVCESAIRFIEGTFLR